MKKSKYIVILLLVILSVFSFSACNATSVKDITGVKQIHVKLNEATDQKLLEGVEVLFSDGSTTTPNLEKEKDFNAEKEGKYSITYSYGGIKKKTSVFVYGQPKIYFDNQEIVSDKIEITFGQANASYDFTKGIKALDSFGNELDVVKREDSEVFGKEVGEYIVSYSAEDSVGNVLNITVTFVVTVGDSPVVSGGNFSFDANGCLIPCDLKGRTGALLFDGDALVNPDYYSFNQESLILMPEYAIENIGEHNFVVETDGGRTSFSVNIIDEGYPLFDVNGLNNMTFVYGGASVDAPFDKRPNPEGYTYEYILKNLDGEKGKVNVNRQTSSERIDGDVLTSVDYKLSFHNADGTSVVADDYILVVKATASSGKVSEREYSFNVINPSIVGGEKSIVTNANKTVASVNADYYFEKEDNSDAWGGRFFINAPANGYKLISFDIYVDYCQSQANGKVNAKLRTVIDNDYERIIYCENKSTGERINVDDMAVKTWYTVTVLAMSSSNGVYVYFNPYGDENPVGVKGYIANFNVDVSEGLDVIFKSGFSGEISAEIDEDGTLITKLKACTREGYKNAVHITPFSDKVWAEYLNAQEDGGKVMTFDIKFEGNSTFNGHINDSGTYMSTGAADWFRQNYKYVRFYDTNGEFVSYESITTDKWYKMVFDIDAISERFGKMSTTSIAGFAGSSLRFGANSDNEIIYAKNVAIVDSFEGFISGYNGGVTITEENGQIVTTIKNGSGIETPFSNAIANEYIKAQAEGGKLFTFDIKFDGETATYNGVINNVSTYMSNNIRGNSKYVRFYDADGKEVFYQDSAKSPLLQTGVWYKMVFDIDAIKKDVGAQIILTGSYAGLSLRIYANEEGNTISIKNVEFIDAISIAFKSNVNGGVTITDEDGQIVSTIKNGTDAYTPFSNTVANEYIKAQTEGGKLFTFDVKFSGTATYNGYLNSGSQTSISLSSMLSNTGVRGNSKYVRLYDVEGNAIDYNSLETGVWYKMVFDIDAIKADIGEQAIWGGEYSGLSLRIHSNNTDGSISIKNVAFIEKA